MDTIAHKYIKMLDESLLSEMTVPISGDVSGLNDESEQIKFANVASRFPKITDLSSSVEMRGDSSRFISVLNGKAIHYAVTASMQPSDAFPFEHFKQRIVTQSKDAPKGIAREGVLHIINHIGVPLVTDDKQTLEGHNMWRKLVPQAIDSGHSVHMWDGRSLHQTTRENVDAQLNEYYGKDKLNHHSMIYPKEVKNGK